MSGRGGRHLRSEPVRDRSVAGVMDGVATVRAALLRSAAEDLPPRLKSEDLHRKICLRPRQSLIIFVVDASESMATGAQLRMKAARGAILGLLAKAYQRRDQVALIAFRGEEAEVLLPPSAGIDLARSRLRRLAVGGATPFAHGLHLARQLIEAEQRRNKGVVPTLVILSDGEANVPLSPGADVFSELRQVTAELAELKLHSIVVDSCSVAGGSAVLRRMAEQLGAAYHRVRDLHAGRLSAIVRAAETE